MDTHERLAAMHVGEIKPPVRYWSPQRAAQELGLTVSAITNRVTRGYLEPDAWM